MAWGHCGLQLLLCGAPPLSSGVRPLHAMIFHSRYSPSERRGGFINHEGLLVGFVCVMIAAFILPFARKVGATWLAIIGGLVLLFGLFILISDLVTTIRYHRRRSRRKKDSHTHEHTV